MARLAPSLWKWVVGVCAVWMWACVRSTVHANGDMWYGRLLNATEEMLVLNKAATEIQDRFNDNIDCGVRLDSLFASQFVTAPEDARLEFMDDALTRTWQVRIRTPNQATSVCYEHFDCWGVAVFHNNPPQIDEVTGEEIMYARYMMRGTLPRAVPDDLDAGGVWFASYIWRRLEGYDCPSPHVDTQWYRNTWHGRLDHRLTIPIPSDPPSIVQHFKTVGHLYRLWPNRECRLTPLLLTAESGCTRSVCPSFSVCPEGFRTRDDTNHWCLRSDGEQTYNQGVFADSYLANNGGSFGAHLPCTYTGFQSTTGGFCGYDLTQYDAGTHFAQCICASPSTPMGDGACQFQASDFCVSPLDHLSTVCNNQGACVLHMDKIDWDRDDLNLATRLTHADIAQGSSPAIQCSCDNPTLLSAPWCDVSQCSSSDTGVLRDCHNDPVPFNSPSSSPGTCVSAGHDDYTCFCNDFYFGSECQFHDIFPGVLSSDSSTPHCFISTTLVDIDIPGRQYAECSGHGMCGFRDPVDDTTTFCTCADGYSGDMCQFSECGLCGPYGKCVRLHADATESGEFETECSCVVDAITGIALASKDPLTGKCSVDKCLDANANSYGTLVVNTTSMMSTTDPFAPPTGYCDCAVMPNGLQNVGTVCDTPICAADADGNACGIALDAVLVHVCKSCKDNPGLLQCADVASTIGAVCDCEDMGRLPDTRPYWESFEGSVNRMEVSATKVDTNGMPVCTPYCKHGQWGRTGDAEWGCMNCAEDGWGGDQCNTPFCLHGTFDPATMCVIGSCEPGWKGILCSECDPAFGVFRVDVSTYDCAGCMEGWVHAEVDDAFERAQLLANETCVPCATRAYCASMGTTEQVCHHDSAATKITCTCSTGYAGTTCSECSSGYARLVADGPCVSIVDHANCDGVGVSVSVDGTHNVEFDVHEDTGVLIPSSVVCVCNPNFDALFRCSRCTSGFAWEDNHCVPCMQAAGCFVRGTRSALCSPERDGLQTCQCISESGYTGSTCHACIEGAFWDDHAQRCVLCALDCGPNGTPDCTSDPPQCLCFNGYAGVDCSVCSECGHGGVCNSGAFFSGPWCTCANEVGWEKSITASTFGATEDDIRTAPCDRCANGTIAYQGQCDSILRVCGPGADLDATQLHQECFCASAFKPLVQQLSGTCETCRNGGMGPDCIMCPSCPAHATCQWVSTDLRQDVECVCDDGFMDSAMGPCTQCDFPRFQGQYCNPCPDDCGTGVCAVEPLSQSTYCVCPLGSRHVTEGDSSSACSSCPSGTTSRLCLPCPRCGPNSVCLEQDGSAVCTCNNGFTRHPDQQLPSDDCFDTEELTMYMASLLEADDTKDLGYEPPVGADTAAQLETYAFWAMAIFLPIGTFMALVGGAIFLCDGKRRFAREARQSRHAAASSIVQ